MEDIENENENNGPVFKSSPNEELKMFQSMSGDIACVNLAKGYLDAIQTSLSLFSKDGDDDGDDDDRRRTTRSKEHDAFMPYSMSQLIFLKKQLASLLKVHSQEIEFQILVSSNCNNHHKKYNQCNALYQEIKRHHEQIQKHVYAKATLHIQKFLKSMLYPSPSNALKTIQSKLQHDLITPSSKTFSTTTDFLKTYFQAIAQMESTMPHSGMVQRVHFHFLISKTIHQDKILKMPHLLMTYMREQTIPLTLPTL